MTAELILEQAALTEQLQWDKRHKEELVLQLIRGEGRADQLQQVARFLELDLAQPRVVAVLALEEAEPAQVRELVHLLENPERDNLVAINGLDEIVVLKPAQLSDGVWQSAQERSRIRQLLSRIPHFKVRIGVGDYFAGIPGLALSYQTARDTLRRGMRQSPRKQVYFSRITGFQCCSAPWRTPGRRISYGLRCKSWRRRTQRECCKRRCANISCRIVICIPVPKPCSFTPTPCVID